MSLKAKVQENPIVSILTTVVLLTGAVTGTVAGVKQMDELVLTHAEFAQHLEGHVQDVHPITKNLIEEQRVYSLCDRLDRKMDSVRDRLWELRQDPEGFEERIHELNVELEKLKAKYALNQCANILE